ncbi:MAG: LysR substrate-binding domain-containing protein [Burkholderiaceae bacterium]
MNAPKLTFKQIEAFRSVMVNGSVVGAAKLMNLTQPSVSRTIALLEIRLGYPLFVRRGRRLLPTPQADALYREVDHLYGGLERIAQVAMDIGRQRAGALRVATMPALSQGLVPRVVGRFMSTRPEVTVVVQSMQSPQIAELVSTRQLDVGFIETPLARAATVIEPLPPCRMVALVPADHRLARRRRISIKDLDGERMVMISRGSVLRQQVEEAFAKVGAAPRVVIETPSSVIACVLVAEGAGVAIVGRWAAGPFAPSGVTVCELEEYLASPSAIIYPQLVARMPLADAFAAEFRQELAKIEAGS